MSTTNEYFPETVTHPGFTLNEKLEEIGMSKKEFALRTEKDSNGNYLWRIGGESMPSTINMIRLKPARIQPIR